MSEWWIIDGTAVYADGDVGDMNHAGYVQEMLARDLVEAVNCEAGTSFNDDADISHIRDEMDMDGEEFEKFVLETVGFDKEKWDILNDRVDPRTYGMNVLGWKRVARRSVQTHMFTDGDLKQITDGLYDALGEEAESRNFEIEVMATGKLYCDVPWSVLDAGRVADMQKYALDFAKYV